METTTKKQLFVQLQFGLLMLACTALPEISLSSIASAMFGGGSSFNFVLLATKIIGGIITGIALYQFYQELGNSLPAHYLCITAGGILFALLTAIPGIPAWLTYVALVLLLLGYFQGKQTLDVNWVGLGTQGAYVILMALLLRFFSNINDNWITGIVALIGLVLYYKGLTKMKPGFDELGQKGLGRIKVAIWLSIVGAAFGILLGWIPLLGIVGSIIKGILLIIALVFEFMGYGDIHNSSSLDEEGKQGASLLRRSMIFMLIANVLGIIPVVGIIGKIFALFALWYVFSGWKKILFGMEAKAEITDEV